MACLITSNPFNRLLFGLILVVTNAIWIVPDSCEARERPSYNRTLIGVSIGYGGTKGMSKYPVSGYPGDELVGRNTYRVACSIGRFTGFFGEGCLERCAMSLTERSEPDSAPVNGGDLAFYSASIRFGYGVAPVGDQITAIGLGYRIGVGLGYQFVGFTEGQLMKNLEGEMGVDLNSEFDPSTFAVFSGGMEVALSHSISLTADAEYVFSHTNWAVTASIADGGESTLQGDVNTSRLLLLVGVRVWFVK